MDLWRHWRDDQHGFVWDVANYYAYLPSKFCNNNSFDFKNGVETYLPLALKGGFMPKMTYGMSVMYAPFFFGAYFEAMQRMDVITGFELPFRMWVHWGCILYGLLGLIFLRKFLLKFFDEWTVCITLAIIFLGTNLFYYTMGNSEMSHGALFFLNSLWLLAVNSWYERPTILRSVFAGIIIGLMVLIRPTEILASLIFIFWNVNSIKSLKDRLNLFLSKATHLIIIAAIATLWWIPQFIFWKEKTGSCFFFSYVGEKFFWTDPQIVNILFSYRKGWITYSPLVLFAFAGFAFMKGPEKPLRPLLIVLLLLNIYVLSCWWNWFYGGGFGARCLTQHMAWLSVPIAASCSFFINSFFSGILKYARLAFFIIVFTGISLSLGQTYQFVNIIIHPADMSKETYWLVFGKYYLNGDNTARFWKSVKPADDKKLRSGENRDQ